MKISPSSRPTPHCRTTTLRAAALAAPIAGWLILAAMPAGPARADEPSLQQTVNYIFTGRVDPTEAPDITDPAACVVVVPEPRNKRFARYYLKRFNIDGAWFSKRYAGRDALYTLEIDGTDTIVEYLTADKSRVSFGFKSTRIPVAGNVDQTQKALERLAVLCPKEEPRSPF